MNKVKNMIGYQSEFFEVLGQSPKTDKSYCTYWYCLCECGRLFEARGHDIRRRRQKSCGCQNLAVRKHGAFAVDARPEGRKTYSTWGNMVARCNNPKNTGYRYYGARSVSVCARWNPKLGGSFENFVSDMGYRPKGTTIGRSLDTGNYQPGNCYWQTRPQQEFQRLCKRLFRKLAADCPELIPEIPLYGLRTAGSQELTASVV